MTIADIHTARHSKTKTFFAGDDDRPKSWRRHDAWHESEVAPCGEAGQLKWRYCSGLGIFDGRIKRGPDLSDCLVTMPKRFRIVVWEPLLTDAPGPHLASPLCCYINTVIFYYRPYVVNRFKRWWRSSEQNKWLESKTGSFFEWDQITSRLAWDDQLEYRGLVFEKGGGRVMWTHAPGERRRWWMRHGLRRMEARS